jgi:hypothetical protein
VGNLDLFCSRSHSFPAYLAMLCIFFIGHVDYGFEVEVGKASYLSLMDGKNIRISDNIGVNKFEGSIQI